MNNKGFAISTMLYGLSVVGLLLAVLMVQTVSASRGEQRKLVESIEDELTEYELLSQTFKYEDGKKITDDSGIRKYQVPITGWYKIELWESAKFADEYNRDTYPASLKPKIENINNAGRYSSVTVHLLEDSTFYLFLGKPLAASAAESTNNPNGVTVFCNSSSKCDANANHRVASSNELFPAGGKSIAFIDPYDPEIKNILTPSNKTYKPDTSYLAQKINPNKAGFAKISLVSVLSKKKFNPASAPLGKNAEGNEVKKNGAFYIIDCVTGKVLSYNENFIGDNSWQSINNIEQNSIAFENLKGNDNQKWVYNPVGKSLVNVRTGFSLRTFEPYTDGLSILADSQYSNRPLEKWDFTKFSSMSEHSQTAINNRGIVKLQSATNANYTKPYYIKRLIPNTNPAKYLYIYYNKGVTISGAPANIIKKYKDLEKKVQINDTVEGPMGSCKAATSWRCDFDYRSYWFYIINAY